MMWVVAAGVLGFSVTYVFTTVLELPRRLFLVPHVGVVSVLTFAFFRWSGLSAGHLLARRWVLGLVGAVGFAMVSLTKGFSAPASAHAVGWRLAFDVVWSGLIYGAADALLLTVIPVAAASKACTAAGVTYAGKGRLAVAAAGLAASLFVTVPFHLGFPEYRDRDILGASFGNGVMTVGYLATGSVLTPLGSHMVLHAAAVLRGPATTSLLPPHY